MGSPIVKGNVKETRCFWTWLDPDKNIIITKVKPMSEVELEDAVENSEAVLSLCAGQKKSMLVDTTGIKSISREARNHFTIKNRETLITRFALLVKSPVSVIIGNFFMGINKPSIPAKLFSSEDKAFEWLLERNV